jgi:hypothetical protein
VTNTRQVFKFLGRIGMLSILVGIGAAVFFFGGFFDIASNHPDPDIVNWALVHVRKASIARHATDQPPASLGDPAFVRAGARGMAPTYRALMIMKPGGPEVMQCVELPMGRWWSMREGLRIRKRTQMAG